MFSECCMNVSIGKKQGFSSSGFYYSVHKRYISLCMFFQSAKKDESLNFIKL